VDISVTKRPSTGPLFFTDHRFVALAALAPFAATEFRNAQLIEWDTLFKASRPYVHVMAIRANEPTTLETITDLGETNGLYDCFFKALVSSRTLEQEIQEKRILSDQHSSGKHYLCLRNIVEAFATNSFFDKITDRLACASTKEAFISEIEAASYDSLESDKLHALDVH
jgi:hypothetical protein